MIITIMVGEGLKHYESDSRDPHMKYGVHPTIGDTHAAAA